MKELGRGVVQGCGWGRKVLFGAWFFGGENERTILGREGVELTGNGAGSRSERLGLGGGTARLPGVHTFGAGLLVIFTRFW